MAHSDHTDRTPPATHQQTTTGGSGAGLGIIVGALVVVVGILAYMVFGGAAPQNDDVTISIEGAGSAIEDAGQAVEGAAESAGQAVEGAVEGGAAAQD